MVIENHPDSMVVVSSVGKFHAFNLAEELDKRSLLHSFYTCYAHQKNQLFRHFTKRVDKEIINPDKIRTCLPIAVSKTIAPRFNKWDDIFDDWVARKLTFDDSAQLFIGWSSSSLRSLRKAKANGLKCLIERGSSHILTHQTILEEEYGLCGIANPGIPQITIDKELEEYDACDFIVVPSQWAQQSFLDRGFSAEKVWVNNLGASPYFQPKPPQKEDPRPFRILYAGPLHVRKGLVYLFDAINELNLPSDKFEVWFVGQVSQEIEGPISKFRQQNWRFFGHQNHYELASLINQCDVAIQPSVEEGLSMVIPQCLSCGIPVIATTNTGGADIIEEGRNGFIIPIRDANAIKNKIEVLYNEATLLHKMKAYAAKHASENLSWDKYGDRYSQFIDKIIG